MLLVSVDKYSSKKVIVSSGLYESAKNELKENNIKVLVIYLMLTLAGYFFKK